MTNAQQLHSLIHRNEGYKYLAKVRGSAPYWERTNLCAMVKQLGIPTFFASFSAADRCWKEISSAIMKVLGKPMPEEMDWSQHCDFIDQYISCKIPLQPDI